jgi:predicted DCC family thiol-disulfide oxidoreductase YuxK
MEKIKISPDVFPKPTIFYDGVCNLCHFSVQWIRKRDHVGLFHFESLQSEAGQVILNKIPPSALPSDSVLLVLHGQIYLYADASLMALKQLGGIYSLLGKAGFLIPGAMRNLMYRYIASNRYRWFGRRDACALPEKRN